MKLGEQEKSKIQKLTAQVEVRTGTQVLAVITGKSDAYPEIPWKAFSLGAALSMLALFVAASLGALRGRDSLLLCAMYVLGAGMVLALACIFLHPVSRIFLGRDRASGETRQFARSLFLEKGLSRTSSRKAVLILVSEFERCASIVADTGVADRIPAAELDRIASSMDGALSREKASTALAGGLSELERLLLRHGFTGAASADEVPEEFLETKGPKP